VVAGLAAGVDRLWKSGLFGDRGLLPVSIQGKLGWA
jgi:hypothetical protein